MEHILKKRKGTTVIKDLFADFDKYWTKEGGVDSINLLVDCLESLCSGKNSKDILIAISIFLRTVYKHSVNGIDSLEDAIEDFKLIFLEVNQNCVESRQNE